MGSLLVCDTGAFLFTGQCVAPSPCSCRPAQIDCDHKHLTDVPSFKWIRGMFGTYYIDVNLNGNNLTTIRPYAFASLKTIRATEIYIWAASSEFGTYRLCEQRRFRRACASAQSRQNLRCSLIQAVSQEEPSDRKPDPWPL